MACVRLSWNFTLITIIHFLLNLSKVCSNSYFEIQINSFSNDAKVDNTGECCSGRLSVDNNHCNSSVCRTFFQICLTNYQVDIPSSPECTFGRQVTPVIGQNTFNDSFQNGFVNPIRIPMEFVWPGDFSLIMEAMHDVSGVHVEEGSERTLLSRLEMTAAIDASTTWTNYTHTDENHSLEFSYRVICKSNRYGPRCAKECTPKDNIFFHYTCDSDGNKICLDGWRGQNCDIPVCDGCENGNCIAPNQCVCQVGWEGDKCDVCIPHPSCANGFCYKAFQCICEPGWRGIFCNYDATFCTENNPCRHGGSCEHTDRDIGYQCNCPPGVSGSHCEILEVDDNSCECQNGATCRYVDDGVQECVCPFGFIGERCELEANCQCQNGGSCRVVNGAYLCLCPTGYFGSTCENYSNCLSVDTPCENGGTCLDGTDTYSCVCTAGFIGDYCETDICSDNPCMNGGICNGLADGMWCECPTGYSGTHCQTIDDICVLQPCANGGICFDLGNDYSCNCPQGFEGKDCSVNINECANHPCKNGARCLDLVNDFKCICEAGWQGELCDQTAFIFTTVQNVELPTHESIHVSRGNVVKNSTKNSPVSDLHSYNRNESTATDLKQILIYCFCGILIVLIIILICIIVYRKKQVNSDTEKGTCNNEPNNQKVYTDNFSQQKKVLPLSSISIKVCNEESDSYSKGTSKQFSNTIFEDYERDIYSQKISYDNADSLCEKLSKHSYQKKIPARRKSVDIYHPKVEIYTPTQITSEVQGGIKQININDTAVKKEQLSKADYLATQV